MSSPIGARSATGRRRSPLRWLPWVLLLILATVIAVIVLVLAIVDDDKPADAVTAAPATAITADLVAASTA